ncbi:MAG: prespore-specific protein [Podila humilis]|nr:MAG: prespore-specific protein [Podila humilis]
MSHPENTNLAETFAGLTKSDPKVSHLAGNHFSKPASAERVNAAKAGLEKNGFKVHVVNTRADAFETLKSLIPAGASINNAHSTTLEEIGFISYIKGQTPWDNVHGTILAEKDAGKQAELRRKLGSTVDYYLTSVAAITEDGKLVHGDLSGSKVEGVAFGAGKIIVVAGSNKIVKDETEAFKRLHEHAWALESARVRIAYGLPASAVTNMSVINQANPFNKDRLHVVIVNDALGY